MVNTFKMFAEWQTFQMTVESHLILENSFFFPRQETGLVLPDFLIFFFPRKTGNMALNVKLTDFEKLT